MVCINYEPEPSGFTFVPPQKREVFGTDSVIFIYAFI
jgi:hypothetical protein